MKAKTKAVERARARAEAKAKEKSEITRVAAEAMEKAEYEAAERARA